MKTLLDFDWQEKIAVLRSDFNVPLDSHGQVSDTSRLQAVAPTITTLQQNGATVALLSHLGRPEEGKFNPQLSLKAIIEPLSKILNKPIQFSSTLTPAAKDGGIVLYENTRFNMGEKESAPALLKQYQSLGDIFVLDAFASAHRHEGSISGIPQTGIPCCAGLHLTAECEALKRTTQAIQRPALGIFGGSKISTKLPLLKRMVTLCDQVIVGGGIANTLLAAKGYLIGQSIYEHEMLALAKDLIHFSGPRLRLPIDVVVAKNRDEIGRSVFVNEVLHDDKIFDVGAHSVQSYCPLIKEAKTIIWNGPLGLFEIPHFSSSTIAIGEALSNSSAYVLAGGGDTLAAINHFNFSAALSHISTGGGALLEYLAGHTLPGIQALEKNIIND